MKKAWMRDLCIILSNDKGRKMTFGRNWLNGGTDLTIDVVGTKYLSSMKDKFTVKIENLTYKEILEMINGNYFDIEIKAGYRKDIKTPGAHTIFKGGVEYISNVLGDRKSNTVYIFCANELQAKYSRSRLNLTLNSNLNMYAVLDFMSKRAGMKNFNIDESLKSRLVRDTTIVNSNPSSFLENFTKNNDLIINGDSSYGSEYNVWDPTKSKRKIKLDSTTFILTQGYPTLNSEGAHISLIPTFNLLPGDVAVIDNSILDIGISSRNEIAGSYGNYLDAQGEYIITQIEYSLQNRGDDFEMDIIAKSYSYYSGITSLRR